MIDAVIQRLVSDSAVQNAVGTNKADNKYKVYPVACAQPEQNPYYVVRLTGKEPIQCKGRRASDFNVLFDVYSFARTYKKADEMDRIAAAALDGQAFEYDGTTLQRVTFETTKDGFYEYADGLYARIASYSAMIHENPIIT